MKKTLKRPNYAEELLKIIQSPLKNEVLLDRLNENCTRYSVPKGLQRFFPISKHRHSICLSSASTRLQRSYPSWILTMR